MTEEECDRVFAYVHAHPGCRAREIAIVFAKDQIMSSSKISKTYQILYALESEGFVRRVKVPTPAASRNKHPRPGGRFIVWEAV